MEDSERTIRSIRQKRLDGYSRISNPTTNSTHLPHQGPHISMILIQL